MELHGSEGQISLEIVKKIMMHSSFREAYNQLVQ